MRAVAKSGAVVSVLAREAGIHPASCMVGGANCALGHRRARTIRGWRQPKATGRGSCSQARRRAAPLRFALSVTAPLSVADCRGRDEGRSRLDFDGLRRVEQRAGWRQGWKPVADRTGRP
jgi:hypothetical protein